MTGTETKPSCRPCQGDVIGQVSVFNKETTESIFGPGAKFGT